MIFETNIIRNRLNKICIICFHLGMEENSILFTKIYSYKSKSSSDWLKVISSVSEKPWQKSSVSWNWKPWHKVLVEYIYIENLWVKNKKRHTVYEFTQVMKMMCTPRCVSHGIGLIKGRTRFATIPTNIATHQTHSPTWRRRHFFLRSPSHPRKLCVCHLFVSTYRAFSIIVHISFSFHF